MILDQLTRDTQFTMGLLARSPIGAAVVDTDLRFVWVNEAAERMSGGVPAERWLGHRPADVLPCLDTEVVERSLRRVLATGEPVTGLEYRSADHRDPGRERFWAAVQFPVERPDGEVVGAAHLMSEVTERVLNQRQVALLDDASARIGTTLDTSRTSEELLDVAIPRLADAGSVNLLGTVLDGNQVTPHAHDEKMRLWRAAVRWPEHLPAPTEYMRQSWAETDPAKLYHRRLVAGSPIYMPQLGAMSTAQIREIDSGIGVRRVLTARAAGAHSMISVPLIARGVIMGIVVIYRLEGSPPFTPADLSLALDLVSRAAISIDNARLYTRERATALALQRGLLPRSIPEVPGLELAYRYEPAQASAEAGGDWFDVIPLPGGRAALTVGDVTGHDIRAASLMGQLRTAARTLATLDLTPAEILARLDQITCDLTDDETGATCIYAVHDPATGDCDIARAGHPLPALVSPDHSTAFLDLPPGLPLGVGEGDADYRTTRVNLAHDTTLVLYTDGLIEARAGNMNNDMDRLAQTLSSTSQLPVTDACTAVMAAMVPNPTDDIAVLMART